MAACRHGMPMKVLPAFIAGLLVAGSLSATAQHVTMEVQPQVIRLNESATLKLNFHDLNPAQAPGEPDIIGFDVDYVGQEQHFQITNGRQERRLSFNYRLQPRSTGQFRIGPFNVSLNGQTLELAPVTVEVLPAAGTSAGSNPQTVDDLVFARLHIPRDKVYLHERFDVELHLYFRGIQLDRGIQLLNLPSTGLNLEDIQEIGATREAFNGEIYEVRRFRMKASALTAGTIELAPVLRANVLVRRERQRDPFFGGFDEFFGRRETQPLTVTATPVTISILPLPPDNRPEGFGGAVGQFNMELGVEPTEMMAGEPVTLTLRISGRGNFDALSMPSLNLGDAFRSYEPKLVETGSDHKVFEQVFIPRSDSVTEIPVVRFSWFDPEAGQYRTLERGPVPLQVRAGNATSPRLVQAPGTGSGPGKEPLGIDIVDLKRSPASLDALDRHAHTAISPVVHTLPILALGGIAFLMGQHRKLHADVRRHRRSMAPRSARAALRIAEGALERKDIPGFHQALWQAMADYVAHRANLEQGQVTPSLMISRLQSGGLDPATAQDLTQLLEQCEEARFAHRVGDIPENELQARLQRTQDILRRCEKVRL